MKPETFESFLRKNRLKKKIGLREFAKLIGMQPSNYCSVESGSLPAPPEDKLRLIAKTLDLTPQEQRLLFDLAAKSRDDIPLDIKELIKKDAVIPALLRTVEDKEVSSKQIKAIVEDIKSGRYRKPADPFTQENLLYSEDEQVQELIFQIKTSLTIPCRQKLANRLLALFKDAKEEAPDSPGISVGSLRYFYYFLQSHIDLKYPTISITPEYNIYASWRDDKKRVFSVHFLPNGDVRFVIFKPNDRHPERKIRISGTATTDILKETVAPYGVWDWISE